MAQWKRARPITQRSEDQTLAVLRSLAISVLLLLFELFAIVIAVVCLVLFFVLRVCNTTVLFLLSLKLKGFKSS